MATAWSCGSTRRAPLTPAVSISLDTIVYFNDEGQTVASGVPATRKRSIMSGLDDMVLQAVEELKEDNKMLKAKVRQHDDKDMQLEQLIYGRAAPRTYMLDAVFVFGIAFLAAVALLVARRRP